MSVPSPRINANRLVARQVAELTLARTQRWQALGPQDPLASLVFAIVLSGSMAHLPLVDPATGRLVTIEDAPALGRPVSAMAIAQSMRIPATTARRRANELVATGLLVRSSRGFRVDPSFLARVAFTRVGRENVAHLAQAIETLAALDYAPATRALSAGTTALPPGLIERLMIAFGLRTLETMIELYGDTTAAHLFSAIVAANIRHITVDLELARRYAAEDSIPPDDERRPVTLRALASGVEMPYETVRRRVAALVADGLVVHCGDAGFVVPTEVLAHGRQTANNQLITSFFKHMLETLTAVAETRRRTDTLAYW